MGSEIVTVAGRLIDYQLSSIVVKSCNNKLYVSYTRYQTIPTHISDYSDVHNRVIYRFTHVLCLIPVLQVVPTELQ